MTACPLNGDPGVLLELTDGRPGRRGASKSILGPLMTWISLATPLPPTDTSVLKCTYGRRGRPFQPPLVVGGRYDWQCGWNGFVLVQNPTGSLVNGIGRSRTRDVTLVDALYTDTGEPCHVSTPRGHDASLLPAVIVMCSADVVHHSNNRCHSGSSSQQ